MPDEEKLLWQLHKIIREEGFCIHPDKVRVMRKGSRQEVTGIVVNKQPGINRKTLHRFRALLHNIGKTGLDNKKWKGGNVVSEIIGYADFVAMVKPELGARLKAQVKQIIDSPQAVEYSKKNEQPLGVNENRK